MEVNVKTLCKYIREELNENFLLPETEDFPFTYPTIEGDTSNFVDDYNADAEYFDREFVHKYGERYFTADGDTMDDAAQAWHDEILSAVRVYLDSWARLYYALHIDYNPVFNVEEHTTTTYGQHVTDNEQGQRQHTEGDKSRTYGQGTDTSTGKRWVYDSESFGNETQTEDVTGSRTNTEASYINTDAATKDTVTSKQHVDEVERTGNIGVVSATDLLKQTAEFYKRSSFWDNMFTVLNEEMGCYYGCDALY